MEYLDSIGVDDEAVEWIVVTHFDRDHYQGLAPLFDRYAHARLFVTSALRSKHFLKVFGSLPKEDTSILEVARRARLRRIRGTVDGLASLQVGSGIRGIAGVEVVAISPSEAAIQTVADELADLALEDGTRDYLRKENRCSVALHISTQGLAILLGGDVEAHPPEYGWQAVLDEPRHDNLGRVQLVKVPHHGSDGAHHDEMWERLVAADADLLVAPYTALADPIPTEADCVRLADYGRLWQAAPSFMSVPFAEFDEYGTRLLRVPQRNIGRITARAAMEGGRWLISCQEPAFQVMGSPL